MVSWVKPGTPHPSPMAMVPCNVRSRAASILGSAEKRKVRTSIFFHDRIVR